MQNLIKEVLNSEEFIGIIPIESKRLKIKSDNISFAPSIGAYLIMFLTCFVPWLTLSGFFSFIMQYKGASIYSVIIICILILYGLMYLADKIYVNQIKKYPVTVLVLTNSNLYYFILKNNKIDRYNKFDLNIENLGKLFYGEINARTGNIGRRFVIKRDGKIFISGYLKIKNNIFQSGSFNEEALLPIKDLRKIYNS
tara:strand:- start:136 stop:726 length:591 start_codon:yes stop_codon:yes gene_type:complete